MGFDVFGLEPKNSTGKYFRNNVWWWRPLWSYTCDVCGDILTGKDCSEGVFNNGHQISKGKALRIASRLRHLIDNGEVQRYSLRYTKRLKGMPDEQCEFCKGTGRRNDEYVQGVCNACRGKGKVRPFATNYPFNVHNTSNFADFCESSGGFRIC